MKYAFFLIIVIVLSNSCLKKKELPDEPKLNSYSFDIGANGATLRINFTDGDGNFGLRDADTTGVFESCLRRWNLYAEYYELRNGVWTQEVIDGCDDLPNDPDVPFYYAVPWAKPTGQDQTQDGVLKIDMSSWYLDSPYDTIKFIVHVVDRDMHESNYIEVGPYIKQ
jgi:hypothetical protein